MNRHVVVFLLTVGCADAVDTVSSPIPEGTPEAIGVLALLDDPATTLGLLDGPIGLDRRAAVSIVEHRDGEDGVFGTADDRPFSSIAEVDALYYVGEAALDRLADWAWDHDFVPSEEDEVLGAWDGVTFTVGEAERTLALANRAPEDLLDEDLGLDSRAVRSIVSARPIDSIATLSTLYYVGEDALLALRDAEVEPVGPCATLEGDAATALKTACGS